VAGFPRHACGVRHLALAASITSLLVASLFPRAAAACPTCGTPGMPGLTAADLGGGYPLQFRRWGPRLTLLGASDRVIRMEPPRARAPLQVFVAGDPLAPATVAAGFSWLPEPGVGLHVCGPELTLSLSLP
jgi:hypothetical protein